MVRGRNTSGVRTSLPPQELEILTDTLVIDPQAIWRLTGVDPSTSAPSFSPEELYRWGEILDDARDLELMRASTLGDYVRAGISSSLAVAGLGLAFTGPVIGSVIATAALAIGGVSGAFTFWDSGRLVRKDMRCGARLRAIDRAKRSLLDIL